jgi:hypothetical protein
MMCIASKEAEGDAPALLQVQVSLTMKYRW